LFLYFSLNVVVSITTFGFPKKHKKNYRRFYEEGAHQLLQGLCTSPSSGDLHKSNLVELFEKFRGFDEEIAQEFAHSLVPHTKTHASITFRGLSMEITPKFISGVTTLPLGLPWSKDEKPIG